MLKKDLRKLYREKRSGVPAETIRQQSGIIADKLIGWLSYRPGIRCIHSFLPSEAKKEVDTFVILRRIREELPSIKTAAPRIGNGERVLSHHIFDASASLAYNCWGIPEPVAPEEVPTQEIDAVIVPLLIFDKSGHRVGYGRGFYDTFLATCRAGTLKIGVCIFDPVEMISDIGPYDIRMDICITPERIWDFTGQGYVRH